MQKLEKKKTEYVVRQLNLDFLICLKRLDLKNVNDLIPHQWSTRIEQNNI